MFDDAYNIISNYSVDKMTDSQKRCIYTALNLGLVVHTNPKFISTHQKMYKAFKDAGYGAILDINDTYFSTLRADHPVIIFDLSGIEHTNSKKYNPNTGKYD